MTDRWRLDSNKLLWHMDRVAAFKRGERIVPILIDIGLTKYCNARCSYCYGEHQVMSYERIPDDVLMKLMIDAPVVGVRALTLTGDGEPTVHPMWDRAIAIGKQSGLDIGMATNGIALKEKTIVVCLDSLVWCRFNISASDFKSYERIHGVDRFGDVIHNIDSMVTMKRARKSTTTVGMQMVLIPDCLNEVVPLAKIAVELGVDYFVIKQFSDPATRIPCGKFDHEAFAKEADAVLHEAEALSTPATAVIPKYTLIKLANKKPYPHCIDLPLLFQISGNSKCYPCGYLFNQEEYCYGDLKKQTFKEIITSEHYWKVIQQIRGMDVNELCHGCCRHDSTNMWMTEYLNEPEHKNFI